MEKMDIKKWIQPGDGKSKIKFQQSEIYFSLKSIGLNYSRVDNKGIFYFREETEVRVTSVIKIEDMVWDTINESGVENKAAMLNAYLDSKPVKRNDLLKYILRDNLTAFEINQIKLQTDHKYRQEARIDETIRQLEDLQFKKTVDIEGEFNKSDIYYKFVAHQEYILLNHYAKRKGIDAQGFDCWKAHYKKESDIGFKKPLSISSLKLSFNIATDSALLHA